MTMLSEKEQQLLKIRNKFLGIDEKFSVKSYYPQLKEKILELEKNESYLTDKTQAILNILEDLEQERKKAIESETKYRLLVENQNDLIVKVDAQNRFTYVSPGYCAVFGKTEEELIGNSFFPLVHEDDILITQNEMRKLYLPPYTCQVEQRALTKDGWRWFSWSDKAELNENKEVISIIGVGRDITERKQAEQSILIFKESLENSADAVGMATPQGRHYYQNKAFTDLFGDIGEYPPDTLYADKSIGDEIFKTIMAGGSWTGEVKMYSKEKKILDVFLRAYANKDHAGNITTLVGIHTDITERKLSETALKESELRFQTFMSETPVYAYIKDISLNHIYQNQRVLDSLKNNNSDSNSAKDIFDQEQAELLEEADKSILSGVKDRIELEYCANIRNELRWLRDIKFALVLPNGTRAVGGLAFDITDLKKTEDARKKSEAEFRNLFESANDAILIFEPDTEIILEVNNKACEIYGFPREELIGMSLKSLTKDIAAGELQIEQTVNTGRYGNFETQQLNKNGEVIYFLINASVIDYAGRKAILSINRNITERKKSEQALMENENLLRNMKINSPMGMHFYEIDEANNLIFCDYNPAADKILGVDHSRFLGKSIKEAFPPLAQTEVPARYFDAARKGITWTNDQISYSDGKIVGAFEVKAFQTTPGKMVAVFMDITERKKAEEEIRTLNAELENRVKERTHQLETVNRELESFAYSVSHDLRAPLRAIDGFGLALLEDYRELFDGQPADYLERIRKNSQKMATLIDDLLNMSRVMRSELITNWVNISSIAKDTFNELTEFVKGRNIKLKLTEEMYDNADPKLIKLCLQNLLDNAIKFSSNRTDAEIELGFEMREDKKVYHVRDNGIGFDMQYVGKLFGVFQRLHRDDEFPGTGIGLATTQKIIHRHGGEIWVESELNKGTTFYFTLK